MPGKYKAILILAVLAAAAVYTAMLLKPKAETVVFENNDHGSLGAETTDEKGWKVHGNETLGIELAYPSTLELKDTGGKIQLSHAIPYKNTGDCDMVGDTQQFETLTDFNVFFEVTDQEPVLTVIDGPYTAGSLVGNFAYNGAEGCGTITYVFPLENGKFLKVTRDVVQALSGISSNWSLQEILKIPGVISKEANDTIFSGIIASVKMIKTQAAPEAKTLLAKVVSTGGRCVYGECYAEMVLYSDGSYNTKTGITGAQSGPGGIVSKATVGSLKKEIDLVDFSIIAGTKFTGVCPTAHDGQEYTYTFATKNGEVTLGSCKQDIDINAPPFKTINDLYSRTLNPIM